MQIYSVAAKRQDETMTIILKLWQFYLDFPESSLTNAIFTKFVIMPRTRQRIENVRRFLDLATRNQRAITLNRFQQKSHSVFDTIDRNQPVATCLVHESFRSSMTLDFLRQRSALTRATSALRLLSFLSSPSGLSTISSILLHSVYLLLSQPGHVYVGVTS